jgi:GDP-mannose 6-dehydrogenase
MRIAIFGLGYVGCVCAARLAEAGHDVIGVDVNEDKVRMINAGTSPIVEPGLDELLAKVTTAGKLRATVSCLQAVSASELALLCVGTPGYPNGRLNVDILGRLCHEIGYALRDRRAPFTGVVRSTVLPGTTESVVLPGLLDGADERFKSELRVAVNPEFMRESTALKDFLHPPFTLVGCEDESTADTLRSLYGNVAAEFVQTHIKAAEMIKYVANAYHAVKVCFANEVGDVCEALGVDPQEAMRIFCKDTKLNISEAYLKPGFAFGGSCLPKDLRALAYAAHSNDVPAPLLSTILPSNEGLIRRAAERVLATHKRCIGLVGLSFKPGTDDLRESPMVTLAEILIGKGCQVRILDHNVSIARLTGANRRYIEEEIPHISSVMCEESEELLEHAEVLVIGNGGEETERVLAAATGRIVIDLTRGATTPTQKVNEEEICQGSLSSSSPQPSPPRLQPLRL